jgi:hemoglobin
MGGRPIGREEVEVTMDTLYERLGSKDAIAAVVDDFVARCAADGRINGKFARTDIARLKTMLVDQICQASGGPCTYEGRSMRETHDGMGVTAGEFDALVEDLVATLNQFSVPKPEQEELLGLLAPLRGDIVELESPETGTPLPESYRNASPIAIV